MVLTILPPRQRGPSFGEKINAGIGNALGIYEQHQQQESLAKEAERARQHDLSKIALAEQLKGERALDVERFKLGEKAKQREETHKRYADLLKGFQGQGNQQEPAFGQREAEEDVPWYMKPFGEEEPKKGKTTIPGTESANIPDQLINEMTLDPETVPLARELRSSKDAALKRISDVEKAESKRFEKEREYHSSYSKEAEKKANQMREAIPRKEMALNFSRNAIETGNAGYFSLDKLADITGSDLFRTAKGAQLITAAKENLLSNMGRVSARAQNIWFEQRLNSMFPKIGQNDESNLTVQEMIESEVALDKAYLNAYDMISADDEKQYGFVRKDAEKRAHDVIKPLEKEIFNRATFRMKEIEEQAQGKGKLKNQVGKNVLKGTPLTLYMAKLYVDKYGDNAISVAEKNGYYIPTYEEYRLFQTQPQEYREGLSR